MRKILFKGKRIDDGGWIYGSPIFQDGYVLIRFWNSEEFNFEEHLIAPESVSEYTGLTDKNGNKIFEGDVIVYNDDVRYRVFWSENAHAFYIEGIGYPDLDTLGNLYGSLCEVIGNIHDNPELLKERERNG